MFITLVTFLKSSLEKKIEYIFSRKVCCSFITYHIALPEDPFHSVIPHPAMDMVGVAILLGVLCLRFQVQANSQVGIFHGTNILDIFENIKECVKFETESIQENCSPRISEMKKRSFSSFRGRRETVKGK